MTLGSTNYQSLPGFKAGADLSAKQYTVVKLATTSQEVVTVAATTDIGIAVLQNDPTDGQAADLAFHGRAKVIAGTSTIIAGESLAFDTTGRVIDTTTDNRRIIGYALETADAVGELIALAVSPQRY